MRLPFPRVPLTVALMTLASASLAQSTVILPRQAANPSAIGFPWTFPWGWTGQPYGGTRSQTIYASTELTGQSVSGPILIDSIRWRPHAYAPAVTGGQYRIATLELSSTNVGWSVITGDFAANHGFDRKLVYDAAVDGPVVYQSTPGPTMWQPDSWCVEVPLRQPFYYDPAGGNLVIDVDYPSTSYTGSAVGRLDGMSGSVGTLESWVRYPEPGFQSTGRAPVIELSYRTVSGTYPVLIADQTRGPTPLTVQFTDLSYSNQPSGITSWAWDFDSDGTIDSTLQNPSHTYTSCGRYDVTLTVDDGVNPPVTVTDRDLIATDEITADIVATPVATRVLQFTADTNHTATAWAWDLDGDSFVDSTLRNPTFAYQSLAAVTVTLTTSRLCGPDVTTVREIVPADGLGHDVPFQFTSPPGATALFDLEVTNASGIDLVALDMPQFAPPIAPFAVEVWLTAGGQADKAEDPTVWQRIGTATGDANTELATFLAPVHVPNGVYGVALHSSTLGPTATGTAAPVVIQNADLTLTLGRLRSTAPGQPFGQGAVRPLRPWTGTIHYERSQITDRAGHGFLGEGCAGTWPRATLRLARPPVLGDTARVELDRLPDDAVLMMVGFDNRNSALGPLPLDLAPLGLSGCELRVRPDAAIALVGSSGRATWRLPIPNDPALLHVRMFQQGVVFDSAHNPVGAVLSDAAGLVVGR